MDMKEDYSGMPVSNGIYVLTMCIIIIRLNGRRLVEVPAHWEDSSCSEITLTAEVFRLPYPDQ